jgi:hypothetical protein
MKNKCVRRELLWLAFGVGCIITLFLPTVWITRILSLAVIILGITICFKK